jgi:signal transduction histidine kinase
LAQPVLSNERLQDLEQALSESRGLALSGQFAAFAIHEINGSLEAIANLVYLARVSSEEPEQVRNYLHLLEEQLEVLNTISRQTLNFYRLDETTEAIPVLPLAEAAIRIQQHNIAAKKVQLLKELPDHVVIRGSWGAMLQVFSNLIGNAVDALSIEGKLQLRATCANGEANILIADNGHGIPAAVRPRIFKPFFSTKKGRGTGLGLAIVKDIVERHHGRIQSWTSTRVGLSGTVFRISLPAHEMSWPTKRNRVRPEPLRGPIVV